ncbi:MAG: squalene/phytoene synthase family protein [Deltaproteobacteria bacterium]|nr:squalene/phytoene synthase family protein [Deltaproteobacteria bacterium]MBW2488869.1 squalene/phytoene synthase family protein [Deltaproteobacteria bacterium]MBW2515836.1 squalene/phytoene synthase family protein [Deltaproteobacteria bacterium]
MLGPIFVNLLANRRKPPLAKLRKITDPEQFLWQILPHAARTFSFVIVFLPPRMRRALAIAYLYCRMLDTYEDLLPTPPQKESALKGFISRFDNPGNLKPAPVLEPALAADPQERTHVLLVNRSAFVDYHFDLLASSQQAAICRLVRRMGEGMIWASRVFKKQNGILQTPAQLSRYCWHVLGTPILFADEMQRLDQGLTPQIAEARLRQCAVVGEVIQLANITRDLEKDVRRGIFYHPQLPGTEDARLEQCIKDVRAQLVLRALRGFRAFPPFFNAIPAAPISRARGAAMLLIITTYSYYWRAAQKAGLPAFEKHQRITRMGGAFIWLKCVLSPKAATRFLRWLDITVKSAFERCHPDRTKRFVWEDGEFDVVALTK